MRPLSFSSSTTMCNESEPRSISQQIAYRGEAKEAVRFLTAAECHEYQSSLKMREREVGSEKTDSRSPVLFSSRCSVLFLSRLVGKEHDPRRMRFGVDQFQLHLVLDVLKERLAAA